MRRPCWARWAMVAAAIWHRRIKPAACVSTQATLEPAAGRRRRAPRGACADGGGQSCGGAEISQVGPCAGDTVPGPETCASTIDTNCNGKVGCAGCVAMPHGCGPSVPGSWSCSWRREGSSRVAIARPGVLKCWGDNSYGELGMVTGPDLPRLPGRGRRWDSPRGSRRITAGEYHACPSSQTGTVRVGATGPRHRRSNQRRSRASSPASPGSPRARNTLALLAAGGVVCWGTGGNGARRPAFVSATPTIVPGSSGLDASAIASGDGYACALVGGGIEETAEGGWHGRARNRVLCASIRAGTCLEPRNRGDRSTHARRMQLHRRSRPVLGLELAAGAVGRGVPASPATSSRHRSESLDLTQASPSRRCWWKAHARSSPVGVSSAGAGTTWGNGGRHDLRQRRTCCRVGLITQRREGRRYR